MTNNQIFVETHHSEFKTPVVFQFSTDDDVLSWKDKTNLPKLYFYDGLSSKPKPAKSYIKQMRFSKDVFNKLKTLEYEGKSEIIDVTVNGQLVIHGGAVFETYATHGVPLAFLIEEIIGARNQAISWNNFVIAARKNKWPDYQIWFRIKHSLNEADINQTVKDGIMNSLANWMQLNP